MLERDLRGVKQKSSVRLGDHHGEEFEALEDRVDSPMEATQGLLRLDQELVDDPSALSVAQVESVLQRGRAPRRLQAPRPIGLGLSSTKESSG